MLRRTALLCACCALSACGGPKEESSTGDIANQAESLQRAADATTDQLIEQIEAEAVEEQAEQEPKNAVR
jgi:hypothetical protein